MAIEVIPSAHSSYAMRSDTSQSRSQIIDVLNFVATQSSYSVNDGRATFAALRAALASMVTGHSLTVVAIIAD
jgi:hypothetical protein